MNPFIWNSKKGRTNLSWEKTQQWLLLCLGVRNEPEKILCGGVDNFLYLKKVLSYTSVCICENLLSEKINFSFHYIHFS